MWGSYFRNDALPLWRLAIPLMLTVPFFETLFLARLGADNLAAGALVGWLFGTLAVISLGIYHLFFFYLGKVQLLWRWQSRICML